MLTLRLVLKQAEVVGQAVIRVSQINSRNINHVGLAITSFAFMISFILKSNSEDEDVAQIFHICLIDVISFNGVIHQICVALGEYFEHITVWP